MSRQAERRTAPLHVFPATASDLSPGNRITLLQGGDAYFPALEAAFELATHEIYLETYIYEDDATGRRIAKALKGAALRGVDVHLLIDGYGSHSLPQTLLDDLRADGVKPLVYRPKISPWTFRRKRLRRMHRKLAVADRQIAFVGGINILDDRGQAGDSHPRFDYAVAVEGPLVEAIRLSARRLWSLVAWSRFRERTVRGKAPPPPVSCGGHMSAAFLVRDNFRHRRDIEAAYKGALGNAKSEIYLAHAYFLPGLEFRRALVSAAGRGVRVVLLLPGRVDYVLQYHASRALYGHFLDAGIEIYEYHKSFLHAKVAVIDGHWATVGSSNIDPFSLLLSREGNLVVDDENFGAALTQSLKQAVEVDGRRIVASNWKTQPALGRFLSWLCYGLVRLMMGISGYVPEDGRVEHERDE